MGTTVLHEWGPPSGPTIRSEKDDFRGYMGPGGGYQGPGGGPGSLIFDAFCDLFSIFMYFCVFWRIFDAFLRIFTHFCAFLRIFAHFDAFLRILTHFCVFLWFFAHFYVFLCILTHFSAWTLNMHELHSVLSKFDEQRAKFRHCSRRNCLALLEHLKMLICISFVLKCGRSGVILGSSGDNFVGFGPNFACT